MVQPAKLNAVYDSPPTTIVSFKMLLLAAFCFDDDNHVGVEQVSSGETIYVCC